MTPNVARLRDAPAWSAALHSRLSGAHENHEAQITIRPLNRTASGPRIQPGAGHGTVFNLPRSKAMVWEKPAAINWRFGMEITLYIANR